MDPSNGGDSAIAAPGTKRLSYRGLGIPSARMAVSGWQQANVIRSDHLFLKMIRLLSPSSTTILETEFFSCMSWPMALAQSADGSGPLSSKGAIGDGAGGGPGGRRFVVRCS